MTQSRIETEINIFFPDRSCFLCVQVEYTVCPCLGYVFPGCVCPGNFNVWVSVSGLCQCSSYVSVQVMSVFGLCPCPGYVSVRVMSVSRLCQCPGYVSVRVMSVSGLCPCPGYVRVRVQTAFLVYSNKACHNLSISSMHCFRLA